MKKEVIEAYALKNALEHERARSGSVLNSLFIEGLKKSEIKKIMPVINRIVEEVNKLNLNAQKSRFKELEKLISHREVREGLPELLGAKKGVRMRFSPSASGPLHIGHALTASTSFLYVEKYGGELIVRIEDTNPENSFKESYKLIKEDSEWLFKNKAKIFIQSERIDKYYSYIEKMIKKGNAYVCTCSADGFKEHLYNMSECGCRLNSNKENIKRWEKMLSKKGYKVGGAVVRFKSGMKLKNPAMRDFPLARINETSHPLQGKKYRVWPLMNLAVAVDDMDMKMTHIIRAKDHRDNALRQEMIYKVFKKKYPRSYFLGRIHFKDMELSTTKMREGIENGEYKSWSDAKLPTLVSLRKRKYKPEAFHKFAEQIGLNEVDKKLEKKEFFLLLDDFNKKV